MQMGGKFFLQAHKNRVDFSKYLYIIIYEQYLI